MSDQPNPQPAIDATEQEAVSAQFRLVPPSYSETPVVYSNFAQATPSQHDLTLFFGWYATPPLAEPPEAVVEVPVRPLVAVSVPLGVVPGLIRVLESQLEARQSEGEQSSDPPQDVEKTADKEDDS